MRTPVTVGVVGLGPSGERLARAFEESQRADLRWLCDRRPRTSAKTGARFSTDVDELLADETLDAIAIALPPAARAELVRRALEADKHVYVESPIARSGDEVDRLMRLAARRQRRLLPGQSLLLHPAIRKLKELIELSRLGELYYLTAVVQSVESAGDDDLLVTLAGAAVSAILYLVGDEPVHAEGTFESYVGPVTPEFASGYLRFASGIAATLQLSCLDARPQCRLVAVGSRRTAVFDDAEPERKLTIFERTGARGAEIVSPRIVPDDPVRLQCENFLTGIRSAVPFPGTRIEPAVVRVLERLVDERGLRAVEAVAPARPHLRLAATATE